MKAIFENGLKNYFNLWKYSDYQLAHQSLLILEKIVSISNYPWQISILVQKLSYNEYWGGNRQRLGS